MAKIVNANVANAAIVAVKLDAFTRLTATIDQLNAGMSKADRDIVATTARAVIMATVDAGDADADGDRLGIVSLGKLGQSAFQRALTDKHGKVGKSGKRSKVALTDVSLDMIVTVGPADVRRGMMAEVARGLESLAKQVEVARCEAVLDKATGAFQKMKNTADDLRELEAEGRAKLAAGVRTARQWVRLILPVVPHAVAHLNALNAGKLGGKSAYAALPAKLVVPIMLAGYAITASEISRADLAAHKGCKVLAKIRKERIDNGTDPVDALHMVLTGEARPAAVPAGELVTA